MYLTTHSTHFILRLYGVGHRVKYRSARGNPIPTLYGLLFPIVVADRLAHIMAFITPVVKHWLESEIVQWFHHEGSIRQRTFSGRTTTKETIIVNRVSG